MPIAIEVFGFEGCPHLDAARKVVSEVARDLRLGVAPKTVILGSDEEARRVGFLGSPTIRVNGRDVERRDGPVVGLTCRLYEGRSGVPPRWMIEAAVLHALAVRGILFLCVQNSARSQMAEGIARHLARSNVEVFSAGSSPATVNPLAIEALAEIGVDISGHRSKGVSEIPANRVEAVITLCAEEACPTFLGQARRVHWGLSDPARVQGTREARLQAFRAVRDELLRRLTWVFEPVRE